MKSKRSSGRLLTLIGVLSLVASFTFAAEPPQTVEVQKTIAFTDKAAELLAAKGKDAFPDFKTKGGPWWQGDTYVYVFTLDGTLLNHPIYPQYESLNLITLRDIHMKAFVQQATEIAKSKGAGWFDFMLQKLGASTPTHKWAYVRTVKVPGGETWIVGSGFWAK